MVESGPILGGPMQLSDDGETMSMDGKRVGQQLPKLSAQQARSIHYFTIFPTIFLSTHPDYVLVHRIERISIGETRVTCQFLFHPNSLAQDNFAPGPAIEFWDMTNRQIGRSANLPSPAWKKKVIVLAYTPIWKASWPPSTSTISMSCSESKQG